MDKDEKKYALITGGSSGVGRQYALQLAQKGYHILIVSNDEAGIDETTLDIKNISNVVVRSLVLDLTIVSSVSAIIDYVDKENLHIEVLICNAGILVFGGVTSTQPLSLERIIDLHCKIPTLLCREFGQRMSAAGKGYILIMSSATAWMPYPTIAAYSATKTYLKTFARALCYEVKDRGINVTIVFPGAIDTSFYKLDSQTRQKLLKYHIMLTPETVARKGLNALFKGKHRLIPGLFTKVCAGLCAIMPACFLWPVLKIKHVRRMWE